MDDDRLELVRALKSRLESLSLAGLRDIPRPAVLPELRGGRRTANAPAAARAEASVAPELPASAAAKPKVVDPKPAVSASPPPATASKGKPTPAIASLFENPKMEGPIVPVAKRQAELDLIRAEVASCPKCEILCAARTQTVPGEGNPAARLMFIGEAPGAEEDRTGRPFVGRSGTLLTDMITKGMGLTRDDVFIGNIVKCRPPDNRDPTPEESANCLPYLKRQIEIIRPEFLCLLGKTAAKYLLDTAMPLGRMRLKWHRYLDIPTVVTWHPAYLLRNPAAKKDTWEDLQMLMTAMGIKPPDRAKGG